MSNQFVENKFDIRLRDRYRRKGLLKAEEVEEYLQSLPDVGDRGETVSLPEMGHDKAHAAGGPAQRQAEQGEPDNDNEVPTPVSTPSIPNP